MEAVSNPPLYNALREAGAAESRARAAEQSTSPVAQAVSLNAKFSKVLLAVQIIAGISIANFFFAVHAWISVTHISDSALPQMRMQVAEVQTQVDGVKTQVDEVQTQVDGVKAQIAEVQTQVAENRSAIAVNTKAIAANAEAIAENRKLIEANAQAIAENRKAIEANAQAIAENRALIEANSEKLDEILRLLRMAENR